MLNHLIEQIRSYTNILITEDGEEYININKKVILIPKILNSEVAKIFIDGIKKSKYFIS